MERTQFAGITQLDAGEPLSQDNFSFQSESPAIVDHFARLGAVAHRHDAHPALADPAGPLAAAADGTGGTILAGLDIEVRYTLVDVDNGETAASSGVVVTTPGGLDSPGAPTASADYAGGELLAGHYYYGVTIADGLGGETELSPVATAYIEPGHASGQVILTGLAAIAAAAGGDSWRLWRRAGGGPWALLETGSLATITDDGTFCADASLSPPRFASTAAGTGQLRVTLPTGLSSAVTAIRVYASEDGTFSDPSLLGEYGLADQGVEETYTSLTFLPGRPPTTSRSVGGAHQIDPDTELLDWHWKRPVDTSTSLGSGAVGDVRLALDDNQLWSAPEGATDHTEWEMLGGGGGAQATQAFFTSSASVASGAAITGTVPEFAGGLYVLMEVIAIYGDPLRLQVYTDDTARDADAGRPYNVPPPDGGGVLLDALLPNGVEWKVAAMGWSISTFGSPGDPSVRLTNHGAAGTIQVLMVATTIAVTPP